METELNLIKKKKIKKNISLCVACSIPYRLTYHQKDFASKEKRKKKTIFRINIFELDVVLWFKLKASLLLLYSTYVYPARYRFSFVN